uniref:Uncharacterized protein n=1 Tax=Globisporangium ultimum (strain ATCC 200006 / CBS 805.95 / DAOM BR144) TaxID=431595 RepID=K3WY27_GLOUD
MDDHNVKALVTFAGALTGGFNGPQPSDSIAFQVFVNYLGPRLVPKEILDFFKYTPADFSGKLQRDFADIAANNPQLQAHYSVFNLARSPYFDVWVRTNPYFPIINNLNICDVDDAKCEQDKARRRANFLKLKQAHFFASPLDDVISPWQQSHLGCYSEVASSEDIETKFTTLKVLDMKQTREYVNDTYGLQTLDKRASLFFHTVEGVGHNCWTNDYTAVGQTTECKVARVYNDAIYPVLQGAVFFTPAGKPTKAKSCAH